MIPGGTSDPAGHTGGARCPHGLGFWSRVQHPCPPGLPGCATGRHIRLVPVDSVPQLVFAGSAREPGRHRAELEQAYARKVDELVRASLSRPLSWEVFRGE